MDNSNWVILLLAVGSLAGCLDAGGDASGARQIQPTFPFDDYEPPRLPILLVTVEGQFIGDEADYGRFQQIQAAHSAPFRFDSEERTVWFQFPDVIWDGCDASGLVLVDSRVTSPVTDATWTQTQFHGDGEGTWIKVGEMEHFARVWSEENAEFGVGTNSLADTRFVQQDPLHLSFYGSEQHVGRLSSGYEYVEVPYEYEVTAELMGEWTISPTQSFLDDLEEDQGRLHARFIEATDGGIHPCTVWRSTTASA